MSTKTFSIGSILNFADGRLITNMDDIYELADFMTGESLFTHQLVRAYDVIKPELEKQLPWVKSPKFEAAQIRLTLKLGNKGNEDPASIVKEWADEMAKEFGAFHEIKSLGGYEGKNPMQEAVEMMEKRAVENYDEEGYTFFDPY